MEMLVDPVLSLWVPEWIVEQYKRWNKHFEESLSVVLREDHQQILSNRRVLSRTKARMRKADAKDRRRLEAQRQEQQQHGEDSRPAKRHVHTHVELGAADAS